MIDYQLKGETSLPLLEFLNESDNKPNKIILCSAFDSQFLQEHIKSINFELTFLPKPITKKRLVNALTDGKIVDEEKSEKHEQKIEQAECKPPKTGKNVLLVEDNRINQTIASSILLSFGAQVIIANNGEEAIEAVENTEFDLIFMDIRMPVMDGIQATKILRRKFDKATLPIYAMTANVTEEEVSHYMEIGMNAHLAKPYDKAKIGDIINA